MSFATTTPFVVFSLLVVAGVYDLCCVLFGGTGSTISAFMVGLGFRCHFTVLVIGMVAGHFFGYYKSSSPNLPEWEMNTIPLYFLIFFIVAALVDVGWFVFRGKESPLSAIMTKAKLNLPVVDFFLGVVLGAVFFYMHQTPS